VTPLEIGILLHYRGTVGDYRGGDFSAPAVRDAIDRFRDIDGMLAYDNDRRDRTYALTERGEAYVQALMAVPLPVQQWVMPLTESEAG
jgi:hypothetical protein